MATSVPAPPILSLPDDVYSLLLTTIAEAEPPRGIGWGNDRIKALGFLRLSEVCRRWRSLILSMPSLWAAIVFLIPPRPSQLALERSKAIPLRAHTPSILIPTPHRPEKPTGKEWEYLIALTIKLASRIGTLTARDLKPYLCKAIFSQELPLLDTLHIYYEDTAPGPRGFENTCIDAPNLRSLEIWLDAGIDKLGPPIVPEQGPGLTLRLPSLSSLCITMRELRMNETSLKWIASILRSTPLLETLLLSFRANSGPSTDWDAIFEGRTVSMTHLQCLELEGNLPADIGGLYRCIGSPLPRRIRVVQKLSNSPQVALKFVKTCRRILTRPSYDGLLVQLDPTSRANCLLTVAVFPSFPAMTTYIPHIPGDMPELSLLSIGSIVPSDAPIHRQKSDVLAASLKDNPIKHLVVDAPSFRAWPSVLQNILPLCSRVTHLSIRHPWNHREPGFPVLPTPGILPALDTLSIQPVLSFESGIQYRQSIQSWWMEFSAWLERRAHSGLRVRTVRVYGYRERSDHGKVKRKYEREEEKLRQDASELVDELLDERVYPPLNPRPGRISFAASSSDTEHDSGEMA